MDEEQRRWARLRGIFDPMPTLEDTLAQIPDDEGLSRRVMRTTEAGEATRRRKLLAAAAQGYRAPDPEPRRRRFGQSIRKRRKYARRGQHAA